jgi:hypothetical protein
MNDDRGYTCKLTEEQQSQLNSRFEAQYQTRTEAARIEAAQERLKKSGKTATKENKS